MNKDLVSRLVGANRHRVLTEISDRLESEEWSQKLMREARMVGRVLMSDPDSSHRCDAVELLGSVGNRTDLYALKMACRDVEWVVRFRLTLRSRWLAVGLNLDF